MSGEVGGTEAHRGTTKNEKKHKNIIQTFRNASETYVSEREKLSAGLQRRRCGIQSKQVSRNFENSWISSKSLIFNDFS